MTSTARYALAAAMPLLLVAGMASAGAEEAGTRTTFTIEYDAAPELQVTDIGGDVVLSGEITGIVSDGALAGARVSCPFVGRTYEGRGFSCGFTTVEDVRGLCVFTDPEGHIAVAEWNCQTGATMTSDARCEGRADWLHGTGKFAGLDGSFRMHADQFRHPTDSRAVWTGNLNLPMLLGYNF